MTADRPGDAREMVAIELERVVRRWQQLPLDRALSAAPAVRSLAQALADQVADAEGLTRLPVPELGPAVLADQLTVMVHDHHAAGLDAAPLVEELTALRRALP